MPLVCAKVKIEKHGRSNGLGVFGGKEIRASTRFLAQSGAGDEQCVTIGDWCGENIVDCEFDVGAVVAVVDERESVRRFNPKHNRTGSVSRFCDRQTLFRPLRHLGILG